MTAPSAKKVLVVGVVGGLLAVVLVRFVVVLLIGGVKVLALIVILGLAWLLLRRPWPRRGR